MQYKYRKFVTDIINQAEMRHFSIILLYIFSTISSHLNAQNLVIGTVPPGMVNLNSYANSFDSPNYIDLDCDGIMDIYYTGNCWIVGNIDCEPTLGLIDTNVYFYTNNQASAPRFFNYGDTVTGLLSKKINNNSYFMFGTMPQQKFICLAKMQPDSSFTKYWLRIFTYYGSGFHIFEILKPLNNDTVHTYSTVCKGGTYVFPNGDTLLNVQSDTVQSSGLISSGTCDSTVVTHLTALQVQQLIIRDINVCHGSNYTFPDGFTKYNIVSDMVHYSNFILNGGCDSLIVTNVTSVQNFFTSFDIDICKHTGYTFPDGFTINSIQNNTSHTSHFSSMFGCDSAIQINLKVKATPKMNETISICEGANYTFPDSFVMYNILNDTSYTSHLQTIFGCDSIIDTYVSVDKKTYFNSYQNLCYNSDFIMIDGQVLHNLTQDTTIDLLFKNQSGCDSLLFHYGLNIDVQHIGSQTISVCKYSDFTFPDGFRLSGVKNDTSHFSLLKTPQNCDSFLTTHLTILSVDTAIRQSYLTLSSGVIKADFEWIDCMTGNVISTNPNSFTGAANRSYKVIIKDQMGCIDTSACHTVSTYGPGDVGKYVHIYPNPASDVINIELYQICESVKVRLLNTTGQTVLENGVENSRFVQVNVSGLPKGVYSLQVEYEFMTENIKILVD